MYTFWHVFRRDALDHTRPQNKGKKRRRKDMSKKILAMLMAVAMAFSLLPVTAFATDGPSGTATRAKMALSGHRGNRQEQILLRIL